jgi:hypothetical protein
MLHPAAHAERRAHLASAKPPHITEIIIMKNRLSATRVPAPSAPEIPGRLSSVNSAPIRSADQTLFCNGVSCRVSRYIDDEGRRAGHWIITVVAGFAFDWPSTRRVLGKRIVNLDLFGDCSCARVISAS